MIQKINLSLPRSSLHINYTSKSIKQSIEKDVFIPHDDSDVESDSQDKEWERPTCRKRG